MKYTQRALENQTFQDFEWLVELSTHKKEGSDFNRSMNKMLKRAQGELIVSLQDFITIEPNGLQMFWDAHQESPKFYTAPVGKLKDSGSITWDWRIERGDANWQEWEIDWGSAPLEALRSIGGFDEELDSYWGFDNVNVGLRADLAGYSFGCLPENKAVAIDHDAQQKHPYRERRNITFHNQRLDEFRRGLTICLK